MPEGEGGGSDTVIFWLAKDIVVSLVMLKIFIWRKNQNKI
jgi:hypothetical protein